MLVDSKTVQGRRQLTFTSLNDVIADAELLVTSPDIKLLGNWPLSQLLTHLALAINKSIDGISFQVPWYTRLFGFFIKGWILRYRMPPGFKLPKENVAGAFPIVASPEQALQSLRQAVNRLQIERMTARHPVFGNLTHEEWTQFHLRHAELHLSFAVPAA